MFSFIPRSVKLPVLLLAVLLGGIFYTSCEKEVDINLSTGTPKLVVDGQIETNGFPFVVLTRSVGYFAQIDLSVLENSFVHGAVVKVSDGQQTIQLKEYSLDTGLNGANKFFIYTIDTSDAASLNFRGVAEREYRLTIEHEGNTYTANTKIPAVKGLDSIWFRKPSGEPPIAASMLMFVKYSDPDTPGNYARYFTSRNGELFLPGLSSVFEDDIVNGITIDSIQLAAGWDRSKKPNEDSLGYFFMNDTVTLRWCATDRGVFNFFNTFEYATGTVGNPFAAPVNVMSNIQGGALGVWAGYGSWYATMVVPVQ